MLYKKRKLIIMDLPKRKQIRLKDYDYSQNGAYFVTVCAQNREMLFGDIDDVKHIAVGADDPVRPSVKLSEIGNIIENCWNEINNIYNNICTDKYCIMPDHFHGIIIIKDTDTGGQDQDINGNQDTGGQGRPPLHKIVQGFKSVTTRLCFPYGYRKIWQRSYYEHIIRNQTEYEEIWQYIDKNPIKWELYKYLGAERSGN